MMTSPSHPTDAESGFRFVITPRYTDLDTWRHVNNSALYQFHIEARMQAWMATFGRDSWFTDTLHLRPLRTITQYRLVTHYGADVHCQVRLLETSAYHYRVRTELFQHQRCVGIQDTVMGVFDGAERHPLPESVLTALGEPEPGAEPLPASPVAVVPAGRGGYPIGRTLTARYADFDADSLRAEAASARYMEQARFGTIGELDFGGLGILIAALDMTFYDHRPVGTSADLLTGVSRIGNSSFNVLTAALSDRGLHTVADSVMVMIDQQSGRPTPITDSLRTQLQGLQVNLLH